MKERTSSSTSGWHRIVLSFAIVCMTLAGSLMLISCGPNDEEIIRNGITQELEPLRQSDASAIATMVESSSAQALTGFSIDPTSFYAAYLQGFDYEVGKITVEKDNATVALTVTGKSFTTIANMLAEQTAVLDADESLANSDEAETNAAVGSLLANVVQQAPAESRSLDVHYEKKDKAWVLTDISKKDLEHAVIGF